MTAYQVIDEQWINLILIIPQELFKDKENHLTGGAMFTHYKLALVQYRGFLL